MIQGLRPQLIGLPVLETERLILRAPIVSDWLAFRDYRASPRTAFTGGPKPEHQAAEQFASFFGHWVLRGVGRLIAGDRATGAPLGHFGPLHWRMGGQISPDIQPQWMAQGAVYLFTGTAP